MKLRTTLAAAIMMGLFAAPAFAENIAVINIQEIMHDSTAAKSAKDQIEAKTRSFKSEMSKKEEQLQKEKMDLDKQRAVLAQDAFEKKGKDFMAKANAAQRDMQEKKEELDNALSGAIGQIQKAVLDITTTIAKEKGFVLVIPASQQLYYDPKLDITKEVLTKLNATLPKLNVSFNSHKGKTDE